MARLRVAVIALFVATIATFGACQAAPDEPVVSVLILGGAWGSATPAGAQLAWPGQLTRRLREAGVPIITMNGSADGETLPLAVTRMPLRMRFRPDLVVIAVGTDTSTPDDGAALDQLVGLAQAGPADVLLVSINPALNAEVQPLVARYGLPPAPTLLSVRPPLVGHGTSAERAAWITQQTALAEPLVLPVRERVERIRRRRTAR